MILKFVLHIDYVSYYRLLLKLLKLLLHKLCKNVIWKSMHPYELLRNENKTLWHILFAILGLFIWAGLALDVSWKSS